MIIRNDASSLYSFVAIVIGMRRKTEVRSTWNL